MTVDKMIDEWRTHPHLREVWSFRI